MPSESPPPYESAPYSIRFSDRAREREEATRYGDGARLLREQQQQQQHDGYDDDESDLEFDTTEMEPLEVEEPDRDTRPSVLSRATVVSSRIARSINSKFFTPVRNILIDPVARVWNGANQRFDDFLGRFGNPLMFKRLLYLILVAFTVFVVVSTGVLTSVEDAYYRGQFHDYDRLVDFLHKTMDQKFIGDRLEYMSSMPHMAGSAGDLTLADYIQKEFQSFGMEDPVELEETPAFLTFPSKHMMLEMDGHKAKLNEAPVYDHPKESQQQPQPFHALSPGGDVRSHMVYANYGTKDDLKHVDVKDAIVFMRYGKLEPGLKVMLAEKQGAKAVVMFSDKTAKSWPDGPDYFGDSVQRASVGVPALTPGDILTPGWSSLGNDQVLAHRLTKNVPKIPSMPISWNDAEPFLKALKGHGKKQDAWANGWSSIEWWTGDKNSPKVHFKYEPVIKERQPVWNVFGKISGQEQSQKTVIIGAQRDAYCYGAVDPTSSTAVLLELARAFQEMKNKIGWVPLRTIVFASWDGSEQNFAGSTEWVEYNAQFLRNEGITYINLDTVSGENLKISAHPMFEGVLERVLGEVREPSSNETMSLFNGQVAPISSDGDMLPFTTHVGVPSMNIGFEGATFPRHSCFDSMEWVKQYGDRHFKHHAILGQVVANLVLRFADTPIMEYSIGAFGQQLHEYRKDLERYAKDMGNDKLQFAHLVRASDYLVDAGVKYSTWLTNWKQIASDGEPPVLQLHRINWNSKVSLINKVLLEQEGLPDRNFFKHVVFGPQIWHPIEGGYKWNTFPGVRDAIEAQDWHRAQTEINRAATLIEHAAAEILP